MINVEAYAVCYMLHASLDGKGGNDNKMLNE